MGMCHIVINASYSYTRFSDMRLSFPMNFNNFIFPTIPKFTQKLKFIKYNP